MPSRIAVDMSATLLHHGHIRLLKAASKLGKVVVLLSSDNEIKEHKGYLPELDFAARREIWMQSSMSTKSLNRHG